MGQSWVEIKTVDLYYICQVIDGVLRNQAAPLRGIEDIFGDMRSEVLIAPFRKWSNLHVFIGGAFDFLLMEEDVGEWTLNLLRSNNICEVSQVNAACAALRNSPDDLQEYLVNEGVYGDLSASITRQVFYVLFGNRDVMRKLALLTSGYVEQAYDIFPDSFSNTGKLKRVNIPSWAMRAIYYRDKGRCAICGKDCTQTLRPEKNENYDHIVPLGRFGTNDVTNLQLLCFTCNQEKSDRNDTTSGQYMEWF